MFSVQKLVRGKVLNVPLAVFKHICILAGRFLTFSMVAAVDDDVSFVTTTSSTTASAIATGAEGGATRKLVSMLSRKDKRATAN